MKKLKFVLSLITSDNDYQREQASAAEETARRLGVDIQVVYADSDAITQSQQLLKIIQDPSSDVDGIVLEPAGGTAFPQIARAAASRGTGWVVLNRDVDYISDLRSSFHVPMLAVSSDHEEIGRIQGRQVAAILPKGGSVLYIQGPSGSAVSQQRTSGMLDTKPTNISLKTLKSATWTEESGHRAVSAWLRLSTAHSERVDAVVAHNDFIALGARKAFEQNTAGQERAKWLSLPFLGIDGLPKTGQAWVRERVLTATIVVPPNTVPALEMLVEAIRTNSQPPEYTLIEPKSFPDLKSLAAASGRI
jgi:ABC-type sugar transport system substrate-binding protein